MARRPSTAPLLQGMLPARDLGRSNGAHPARRPSKPPHNAPPRDTHPCAYPHPTPGAALGKWPSAACSPAAAVGPVRLGHGSPTPRPLNPPPGVRGRADAPARPTRDHPDAIRRGSEQHREPTGVRAMLNAGPRAARGVAELAAAPTDPTSVARSSPKRVGKSRTPAFPPTQRPQSADGKNAAATCCSTPGEKPGLAARP